MASAAGLSYASVAAQPLRAEEEQEEQEEEEEESTVLLPAQAPGRLRPAAAASGAAILVAMLLAVAAGTSWAAEGKGTRLRAGSALRRAEETGGAEPHCNSLPEFQRYANAETLAEVKCTCPGGQVKQLCEKGSRSQNACCRPAAGSADEEGAREPSSPEAREEVDMREKPEEEVEEVEEKKEPGKKERLPDIDEVGRVAREEGGKGSGCSPAASSCTLLLTFHDSVSVADMESLAEKYRPEAKPSVMKAIKIMSLAFGEGHRNAGKCCEVYKELGSNSAVASVELDAPVSAAEVKGGASLSIGGGEMGV